MKNNSINIIVVIGAGSIGQAIARRVGAGKYILLADLRQKNSDAAAKVLSEAGFNVSTTIEQGKALATTEVKQLLTLDMLQPGQVTDPLHAYQLSKKGNSLLVMAEAVRWGTEVPESIRLVRG
jgi:NAD(P)-dependent dehydrogenase (short-subunit alcohol dehydrogenase family)